MGFDWTAPTGNIPEHPINLHQVYDNNIVYDSAKARQHSLWRNYTDRINFFYPDTAANKMV